MTARIDVLTALFNLLDTVPGFDTSGQRLMFWGDVPAQPALFTRWTHDNNLPRKVRGAPPETIMNVEVWLYAKQDDVNAPPSDVLAPLVDAISVVMEPVGATTVQTLGLPQTVSHAWIEGEAVYDTGDHSGQAIAKIPVRILCTGLLGALVP